MLEATSANWLVAITGQESLIGIAALDVSTGRFQVEEADGARELGLILGRLQPAELIVPEALAGDDSARANLLNLFAGEDQPALADLPAFAWDSGDARRLLCETLGVSDLAGFGIGPEEGHLVAAAGAAMRYASGAAHQDLNHVSGITRLHRGACLIMDAACRRNLELLRNSRDGSRQGSLLESVDRTRTAPGGRLLAEWLASAPGRSRCHLCPP